MRSELQPRDARDRMIVALDFPSIDDARALVATLGDNATFYKVGLQLAYTGAFPFIEELLRKKKRVFLDLKLLDIDNQVAGGIDSIARLGVTFTTIHAYPKAMRAGTAALRKSQHPAARGTGLLAVTALTSMSDRDLSDAGYGENAAALVARRAAEARDAGMDGIVCSPVEVAKVRAAVGASLSLVTPGIRPVGSETGDQKRISSPGDAIRAGSDYLVVARPILQAPDPRKAAEAIQIEIAAALAAPAKS
jgi:orotidine-5'-phosphate decarboxylase